MWRRNVRFCATFPTSQSLWQWSRASWWLSGSGKITTSTCESPPAWVCVSGVLCCGQVWSEICVFSIADNLPVATRLEFYSNREEEEKKKEKDVQFEHGYRLGFLDGNKVENLAAVWGVPRGAVGVCQKVLEIPQRSLGLGMQQKLLQR